MSALLGSIGGGSPEGAGWRDAVASLADRCPGETQTAQIGGAQLAWRGRHRAEFATSPTGAVALDGLVRGAGPTGWSSAADLLMHLPVEPSRAIERLTGCFALAFVDPDGVAWLYRDDFGTRPLYFGQLDGRWWFASEIGTLLAAGVEAHLDRDALPTAVHYRFFVGPRTLYRGISLVPPGSLVTLRPGAAPEFRRLRAARRSPSKGGTMEEWVARAGAALASSMDALAGFGKVVAIPLSGGIDSSLLTVMARSRFSKCIAYTATIEGYDNPELKRARAVAARVGVEHRIVPVTAEDVRHLYPGIIRRLESPPRHFNNFVLAKLFAVMAEEADTVLCGDTADSLFSGEGTVYLELLRDRMALLHRIPGSVRGFLAGGLTQFGGARGRRIATMLRLGYQEAQARLPEVDVVGPFSATPETTAVAEAVTGGFVLDPALVDLALAKADGHDVAIFSLSAVLTGGAALERNDRLASPSGLRLLYPFLDPDVQAAGLQLPLEFREQGHVAKPVLRRLAEQFVGPEAAAWPKLGFPTPEADWMTGPLADYMAPVFRPDPFLDQLVPLRLRQRLAMPADRQMVWTLMTLHSLHMIFGLDHD